MSEAGFLHLNRGGEWPSLLTEGVVAGAGGSLRLAETSPGVPGTRGWFRIGPVDVPSPATAWFRLRVDADPLASTSHVQLFTFTEKEAPADAAPDTGSGWAALPLDRLDGLIPDAPARRLWVGGLLRGDGSDSPVVHQACLDARRGTYLGHLPAIFGRPDTERQFLERFLALHESVLGGLEEAIDDLPLLFDPACTPDGADSWLTWLSGWLAFERSESWTRGQARSHLSEAFALSGRRGTIEGLRRYLKVYAGVESRIEEASDPGAYWLLGKDSPLGFGTVLAPGPLQGAVLGSSATLDASHLSPDDGEPALDDDDAHRFCVLVYPTPSAPRDALERARAVLEREKPAHTTYHLRMVEARLRVGVQARVGVDAVVGQEPRARVGMLLDDGVLAPAPASGPDQKEA